MASLHCLAVLCAAFLCQANVFAHGKLHTGTVRVGGDPNEENTKWQFLTKFGYAVGEGKTDIRLRLRRLDSASNVTDKVPSDMKLNFKIDLILDSDWPVVEALPPCSRGEKSRSTSRFDARNFAEYGKWEELKTHGLIQTVRPHIWYFGLSTCDSDFENVVMEVDYEIHMLQFDGSEMSLEMRHMLPTNAVALAYLTVFIICFGLKCRRFQNTAGGVHPVILALAAAVALQWVGQALHMAHLWMYRTNGVGSNVADGFADICIMLSQVVNAALLVAIAQGYTLLHSEVDELNTVGPIVAMVAILHVACVCFDKFDGELSNQHHQHHGVIGCVMFAVRMFLFMWFIRSTRSLYQKSGFKLQTFLQRFQTVGSVYFLAYPVIFLVVQLFAEYLQHPILQICLLTVQSASAFWLAHLFLSRGEFYAVSTLSSSFLPGGCGAGSPIKIKKWEVSTPSYWTLQRRSHRKMEC